MSGAGRFVNNISSSGEKFFRISFPRKTGDRQRPLRFRVEDERVVAVLRISEEVAARQKHRKLILLEAVTEISRSVDRSPHYRARQGLRNFIGICRRRSNGGEGGRDPFVKIVWRLLGGSRCRGWLRCRFAGRRRWRR